MGVYGQNPLPKDRLCHVDVEGTRRVRSQWKMVRLVVAQIWMGPERFIDGGLRDVIGDLLGVFGPEVVAEVRDGRLWHRR